MKEPIEPGDPGYYDHNRVVVTDDNIHISITSYRGAERLAEIAVNPVVALLLAKQLLHAALLRLNRSI